MIQANTAGHLAGKFTLPSGIPAGTKLVEFVGDQGSRAVTQFTGRGEIRIEERRTAFIVRERERVDPLAQTFTLFGEGRHIAAVGLWFEDIGEKPVTVQIRETATGLPTSAVLAEARITAGEIAPVGEETVIDFATPVYFAELTEYAIVVLTDDNTHALAIAEVGQYDKRAQRYVTEQGYTVGVLLSSSNARTWTPHNNADLAFRLYGAVFTAEEHSVALNTLTANNASDLYVMADVERTGVETDVSFVFEDDSNTRYRVQDKQMIRLDARTTSAVSSKVVLHGSRNRSPVLYPGSMVAFGDLAETATYISRTIIAGNGLATVTLESHTPSGSAVRVELEIEGEWHTCPPENGTPVGDGWVRNDYKKNVTGGDSVRVRITLTGNIHARPRARALRVSTT